SFVVVFFFFSSRRRHTRFSRDWSSDVCSSDLVQLHAESPLELVCDQVSKKIAFPLLQVGQIRFHPFHKLYRASLVADQSRLGDRSEERRVGKEWRSGSCTYQYNKKRRATQSDS